MTYKIFYNSTVQLLIFIHITAIQIHRKNTNIFNFVEKIKINHKPSYYNKKPFSLHVVNLIQNGNCY